MRIWRELLEFEWDAGNTGKSLKKHSVADTESEEVFFDPEKKLLRDSTHSVYEGRHILIGQTRQRRLLFIVFTKRRNKIRIISSRPLNKKEKHLYEEN